MKKKITNIFKKIFECPKKRRQRELAKSKEVWNKYETYNKGDLMDYDGMGDWGRFPPIRK